MGNLTEQVPLMIPSPVIRQLGHLSEPSHQETASWAVFRILHAAGSIAVLVSDHDFHADVVYAVGYRPHILMTTVDQREIQYRPAILGHFTGLAGPISTEPTERRIFRAGSAETDEDYSEQDGVAALRGLPPHNSPSNVVRLKFPKRKG
jgi:hypothetical protein